MEKSAAIILSVSGFTLTDDERRFFATTSPLGFILFQRNCDNPDQIRTLVRDLRDSVGWHCPILIDQEGGRVQRLKPPHWKQYSCAQACQTMEDVATVSGFIASDLSELNIDVNCAPVMDLLCEQTHDVIGDRAFSDDAGEVLEKGIASAQAYIDHHITPINKHIPGHGRATLDSHLALPVIDAPLAELEATDFYPFKRFAKHPLADKTWGMVAHIIYTSLDQDLPATVSASVMRYIRDDMGCDQFLLADDISMSALEKVGNLADRAVKTLEAGCDATLYCAGKLDEMEEIMRAVPTLTPQSLTRYDRSRIRRRPAA